MPKIPATKLSALMASRAGSPLSMARILRWSWVPTTGNWERAELTSSFSAVLCDPTTRLTSVKKSRRSGKTARKP